MKVSDTDTCHYWKNDFGEVFISFIVRKPNGVAIANYAIIATLPVGFRPQRRIVIGTTDSNYTNTHTIIHPSGGISISPAIAASGTRDIYMAAAFQTT